MESPRKSDEQANTAKQPDMEHDAGLVAAAAPMDGVDSAPSANEDILARQDMDPVLNMKMHLVNNAIDEIGWTPYHWKLFILNGFGYAVDSLVLLLQSVIAGQAFAEFGEVGYSAGLNVSVYTGMLTGAIFWGLSADIIGRRWAFNISLFVCSIAAIVAGAAPNWPSLGFFIAVVGFGGGGNLVLDTTVFLEYLPGKYQWVLTLMACWWGLGQAVTGAIAWGFLVPAKWNCDASKPATCTYDNNMGWRYVMYTAGAMVFLMSLARISVIRLKETPKYHLGAGKDAELVEDLQALAAKYNRPCSITVEQLQACGEVHSSHGKGSFSELGVHFSGLFATSRMGLSTTMIWFSWMLIGLAYPLFYVFLPDYLASRGVTQTSGDDFVKWRNYTLTNISGIFGPVVAGPLCNISFLGRRYTMVLGALLTMAFFFAYTAVNDAKQDVAFSCVIGFCLNIYYGTLYAYTPEVLPSAHRATGNGVAVAFNRLMGIISSVIGTTADTSTTAPIYVCAALFLALAGVAGVFPFEPYGKRSS